MYVLDFKQLACDINWDEEVNENQFYYELWDDAKDLLLSLHDPETLSDAINQVVKRDNQLFQHRQDQRSWTLSKLYKTSFHLVASTNISSTHLEVKNMQIDEVQSK